MNIIVWARKAARQLRKLDRSQQAVIRDAVTELGNMPNCQNVKALTAHEYGYRMRVGNYRVLFDWMARFELLKSRK